MKNLFNHEFSAFTELTVSQLQMLQPVLGDSFLVSGSAASFL